MTQTLIRKNLIKYLKFKIKSIQEEIKISNAIDDKKQEKIKELQAHLEVLEKKLVRGQCFGLAISDAALTAEGYEAWWHQILYLVATWDKNDFDALNDDVDLKSYLPASHQSNDNRRTTLDDLFEMVLNYILMMHASSLEKIPFMPEGLSQLKMVEEGNPFFEILINKKIKRIEHKDSETVHVNDLARYFDKNKNAISGSMCLLHNDKHVINIRYQDNQWSIYNSNYQHNSVTTMIKEFKSIDELVEEIKITNQHCVSIDVMSLRKNKKVSLSHYGLKLTEAEALSLLEPGGLYLMLDHTPHTFVRVMKYINESKGEAREKVFSVLAQALKDKNGMDNSLGLHLLTESSCEYLQKIIEFANDNVAIRDAIFQSLLLCDRHQRTSFHNVACDSPDAMSALLALAENNGKIPLIAEALDKKTELRSNGFQLLTQHAPDALSKLLELAKDHAELSTKLAEVLTDRDKDNRNGLHYIAIYASSHFEKLFQLAENNEELMQAITDALVQSNSIKNTGFHSIAIAREGLAALFHLADHHDVIANATIKVSTQKNINGNTVLDLIEKNPGEVYSKVIDIMLRSQTDVISQAVLKIRLIINSKAYWRTKTFPSSYVFPKTVDDLRDIVKKNKNFSPDQLLEEFKKVVDQSIKYKEQHPVMYVLNSGRRCTETKMFYKLLSDLPENKNEALTRLDTIFNQVVALQNTKTKPLKVNRS